MTAFLSAEVSAYRLMALFAPLIPNLYNTQDEVRRLATSFLYVVAVMMPFNAFTNGSYFTLRSGGKTVITFLFDSAFIWVANVPIAMALVHWTELPIFWVFVIVQSLELVKVTIGAILLKRRAWVNNLVDHLQ